MGCSGAGIDRKIVAADEGVQIIKLTRSGVEDAPRNEERDTVTAPVDDMESRNPSDDTARDIQFERGMRRV
jgi:hypothetical protein